MIGNATNGACCGRVHVSVATLNLIAPNLIVALPFAIVQVPFPLAIYKTAKQFSMNRLPYTEIETIIREMLAADAECLNQEMADAVNLRLDLKVDKKTISRIRNQIGLSDYRTMIAIQAVHWLKQEETKR
ncbi:MAG: hypothetical protein M3347_02955 [Armatimonadota bacterium]|nr:hypothetical protein [Armatimonadota bacterium]